jgi:hypothetical protein
MDIEFLDAVLKQINFEECIKLRPEIEVRI